MPKSPFYKLFGLGRIPRRYRPALEREGIDLLDEGVPGSISFRNFRAPGRRYSRRRTWIVASMAVTSVRIIAYAFGRPILDIPRGHERLAALECSVEGDGLRVRFDAAAFHEGWSGDVEYRFATDRAREFAEQLRPPGPAPGGG